MGYLHINNLYKDQTILMFKECYALEKIHGTSAHVRWDSVNVGFFSGGEKHEKFLELFDKEELIKRFTELNVDKIVVYGEAYGGKQQGMSATYGKELKFIVFDVKIEGLWLDVPKAEGICKTLGLEFISYNKIFTNLDDLDAVRDLDSVQAVRNGCGEKIREGVVLRPLIEVIMNNGKRVIAKHKRDEFMETKTPRKVRPDKFILMTKAREIADEWVTEMRLTHILGKLPSDNNIEGMKIVLNAMVEDVFREAEGEITTSKEVIKAINRNTALMFKDRLKNNLYNNEPTN